MVKADPTRNYYADLRVAATANDHEIRKAFRALALQYHPDRNPGREADVVVRFQEIQAANEVLSDPTQRAKYDADRRNLRRRQPGPPHNAPNTPRSRPPPPPRTAYTTTPSGSYYRPPPPKPAPQAARPPPPQRHPTYTAGADRFANKTFRPPPPTAPRPPSDADARANVFTAWQKMKMPRAAEPRRPYTPDDPHSAPPKKPTTNPNGTPFGRSQSTRVSSSKAGFDPSTPGVDEGQARSAYRNYARPAPTPPSSTTPLDHSPPARNAHAADDAPYAEANRLRTPYSSAMPGERTSMFHGVSRSTSVRNSPTNSHHPNSSHDTSTFSDLGRRGQRSSHVGKSTTPFSPMYPDSSEEEEEEEEEEEKNDDDESKSGPLPANHPSPSAWAHDGLSTPVQDRQTNGVSGNMPNSFKSRSEENINIKFSPSDWHGKFQGSADYFAPNLHKASNIKGRASPSRGRPGQRHAAERPAASHESMGPPRFSPVSQPVSQPQPNPIPPPPPGPPPNANFPVGATFSQQAWAQTFQDPHWIFTDKKETSPRRASEAKPRSRAGRKASVPQQGSKAQEQSDVSRPKYQAFAEETVGGETDAMDIDPPAVPKPARRASQTAPSSPKPNTAAAHVPSVNDFAAASSSATAAKPPRQGLNGIGDLAEPLLAQHNGSIGLDDIKHALPFESQPSKSHPTKSNTVQPLRYPDVPFPPPPPPKIEQHTADEYFNRMESYVKAYKRYSKNLTDHFNARNLELEDLDDHFIHHRGETTKKLGFASYLTRMKEDEAVMQTWQVAQEKHIQALQQCEDVRNKAMKMYQTLQV